MKTDTLGQTVHSYFLDYLITQRGLRPATIRSYRDVLKLFLAFVAEGGRHKVTKLGIADLGFQQVQDFLKHLEGNRGNSIRTRNHRLTVFAQFLRTRGSHYAGCSVNEPAGCSHSDQTYAAARNTFP